MQSRRNRQQRIGRTSLPAEGFLIVAGTVLLGVVFAILATYYHHAMEADVAILSLAMMPINVVAGFAINSYVMFTSVMLCSMLWRFRSTSS